MGNEPFMSPPPAHGGQLRAIAAQFSVCEDLLLDFSANIYPDGPSSRVLDALGKAIRNPEHIRAYPDLESLELREALVKYTNVAVGNVLVANGMVPLLSATLRALNTRKCMLPVPAFGEYRRTLSLEGIAIEKHLLAEEAGFRPNLKHLLACCKTNRCDTLLLTNPHNPTGGLIARAELKALVRDAEASGIRILLDEAFIDFAPEESVSRDVTDSNNLFVFRSVTKFFAMAGMRVAYLIAPAEIAPRVADLLDPWPISWLASVAAVTAVKDAEYIAETIACNRREREVLSTDLAALGLPPLPSRANFLLVRLNSANRNQSVWEQLILQHGIVVRNCATFEGLDNCWVRVAVRRRQDNQRLIRALDAVLNDHACFGRQSQCI